MVFSLGILLAILAAAGLCLVTWRGVQSSAIITNPFSELPDDAFRECATMVKKRYTFFFLCCLVILISLILIYSASAGAGENIYLLGVLRDFSRAILLCPWYLRKEESRRNIGST